MKIIPIRKALLSVSNKDGVVDFAKALTDFGVQLISTGGTSDLLRQAAIPHQQVEEVTGWPEMLGGRVKTLHPKIQGGILGRRDIDQAEAAQHQIDWIDLVVVNFYPFAEAIKHKEITWEEAIEFIDVGGPTMVRAAAKNAAWTGVVIDPLDYPRVIDELREHQGLAFATRQQLAKKVFTMTAEYDAMIRDYLSDEGATYPEQLTISLQKQAELRYGENPHQSACAYQLTGKAIGLFSAHQYQGKPLSHNNLLDAESAWCSVTEFDVPASVIVKHANPCGVAEAETIDEAFLQAYEADALSAFGGVVALNRPCTKGVAEAIIKLFTEVVLAPAYCDEALALFTGKPNLRVLQIPEQSKPTWEMRYITGGVLLQEKDQQQLQVQALQIVTNTQPTAGEIDEMLFAWRVLKHIKSNAILIAKQKATVGIGAGQVSRVDAVELALRKAGEKKRGAILASDAFFPFRDSIDRLAGSGIKAIIQPGGSVRDNEVIAACNELGIAMVFTGKRCFRH